MKKTSLLFLTLLSLFRLQAQLHFEPDFEKAKRDAATQHKLVLLNFSGSDWCGPCIQMRKDFLENETFLKMADSSLILVNADFPQKKKNQPPPDRQKRNQALAEQYNGKGRFPYTLLLNPRGEVLTIFDGRPSGTVAAFIQTLKTYCDGARN